MIYMTDEAIFVRGNDTALIKRAIARILYSKNIEQSKISEILNLSQPMVSNYCSSNEKIPNNILKLAKKISNKIIEGHPAMFHTCISFSDKTFEGDYFIAGKNEIISDESSKIVDNLTQAFLLLKGKNISGFIPEVKINIAMTKENPAGSDDVAAFLNGLIIADDKITGYNGIRFGRSKHLSSLLLDLSDRINVDAIMNIAYVEKLENIGFNIGYLTKDFKMKDADKQVDILLHKGDFGIEPCAYILGKDAVDVVNKVLKIKEEIK